MRVINNVLPRGRVIIVGFSGGRNQFSAVCRYMDDRVGYAGYGFWKEDQWDTQSMMDSGWHTHWLHTKLPEDCTFLSFVRPNDKNHKIKRWIRNAAKKLK